MIRQIGSNVLAAIVISALVASCYAQDYDGEAETAITGLSGLSGLSGLGGLSALTSGVVTGYAPMSAGSEISGGSDGINSGEQGLGASESSDAESGDYDEDSNDSSASEEHPILSKFINLISGGRHKRSVSDIEAPVATESHQIHSRVKRGYKGWVPYVSTYVKTDKKANFKWGVSVLQR